MKQKTLQTKCLMPLSWLLVCTASLLAACSDDTTGSPEGYDLNNPQIVELGKTLNEISGIAWDNETKSLVAISDSKEKIIQIGLKNHKLKDLTGHVIPKDSDTEDMVLTDSVYYLLSSWGEIRKIPKGAKDTSQMVGYRLGMQGKNDFETLYYDPTSKGLIMLCKNCSFEKGEETKSAFRFDTETNRFDSLPVFSISTNQVREILKNNDIEFDPSAAAINPISKRVYILSSAEQVLAITDNRGEVVEAYKLNPDKYPQAEGIAFAPNGDMYISNEGKYGKPTLLYFPYRQHGKKTK